MTNKVRLNHKELERHENNSYYFKDHSETLKEIYKLIGLATLDNLNNEYKWGFYVRQRKGVSAFISFDYNNDYKLSVDIYKPKHIKPEQAMWLSEKTAEIVTILSSYGFIEYQKESETDAH